MNGMRNLIALLHVFALALVLDVPIAQAQLPANSATTSTPIPGVGHDYIGALGETVDPATGSVTIQVNTMIPPGRGLKLPFSIVYNTNGVDYVGLASTGAAAWQIPTGSIVSSGGGWAETAPIVSVSRLSWTAYDDSNRPHPCFGYVNYVYQDPQGGRHNLNLTVYNDLTQTGPCSLDTAHWPISFDGQIVEQAGEAAWGPTKGTIIASIPNSTTGSPITVSQPDGTVFNFPQAANQDSLGAMATSVEDRNGNVVTITPPSSAGSPYSYSDTLGRTVLQDSGFGNSPETITIPGLNIPGSSGSYKIYWTTLSRPTFTVPVTTLSGSCALSGPPAWSGAKVISSITLPNGKSYSFSYDAAYGLINRVTYPTGAYVRYVWGVESQAEFVGSRDSRNPCTALYGMPVITERYVSFDGSTESLHQHFAYTTTWNTSNVYSAIWTSKQTTVSTTDLVRNLTYTTAYTYSATAGPEPPNMFVPTEQLPVESSVAYYDTNGTLLKTVSKVWANARELSSETTQYPSGPAGKTSWTYNSREQVTEQDDYDFGSSGVGSLLRKTVTNYQTFSNTPIYTAEPSIVNRPCQVITYDSSGTNRVAENDYSYDNGATTTSCGVAGTPSLTGAGGSSITGHDETHYSASATSARGNLTEKTQWLNTGTSPFTTYSYDETGQVLSMTDPNGNLTSYSYSDSFLNTNSAGFSTSAGTPPSGMVTNAYVAQITYPVTNGVAHVQQYSYGYNDGEVTRSIDQNSQQTTYGFNDLLGRLTETDFPDGGQTFVSYNDNSPSPSVTTCRLINGTAGATCSSSSPATGWKTSVATMDGLGHVVQTALVSDPDGTTYTAAAYDGLGRVYQSWNPTRCPSPKTNCGTETTWGVTTSYYDALGRPTQVTKADGSLAMTSYNANQVTVTDEVGAQRKSQSDGLGRLTFLWEAPNQSGYNYETDYVYDALDNLLSVTQNGSNSANARVRNFQYDSLSRLTQAVNPESGTTTYLYDLDGNLTSKVAPKPGQISTATVTTNYTYDALNRLTLKSYVGITNPPSKYQYDGQIALPCQGPSVPWITGATNMIGRRSGMCSLLASSAFSYDAMGRPTVRSANKGSVVKTYLINYSYYKDGSVNAITYPSGDVITYAVGGAGRAIQVSDANNNFVGYPGISATYAPNGALATMVNGKTSSFGGITTSNIYNDRFQPILLSSSVGSTQLISRCYDFHLGIAINSTPCSFGSYSTGDNGNVFQVIDKQDSTRSTAYSYDPLNRLAQANTVNTSGTNCWGEIYTTDSWGNMTNIAGNSSMPTCFTETLNAAPASTKNQLTSFSYDAAGNLTDDGRGNQPTYDAENRIATVAGYSYYYDADGQRMEKSNGTTGTMYWTSPTGEYLAETDLTGTLNEEYVFFNGSRIARVDRPSGKVNYYFSDHIGSASLITGASGSVQERYYYYPYGGTQSTSGTDPNHYKFSGKERDTESGLDNFDFRYFGSSLGRFMSPDDDSAQEPSNPQSWNLYSYVMNRPTVATDPDGHDCVYTSNQTSQGVTVTVERGACSDVNTGTYVSGTIDVNSLKYNGQTGDLSYSFQDSAGENGGVGVIALNAPAPQGQLTPEQTQILSQAGEMGIAGVKWGAIEMGQQALGIGLGRLAAAGVEAVMAGRAAKAAEEAVDINNLSNKITRQMTTRGWTKQEILDTVREGDAYAVTNKATGGPATEYVSRSTGKFVVIDNKSGQVLQVGGQGFSPNHWVK